jgi:hypothetical protein
VGRRAIPAPGPVFAGQAAETLEGTRKVWKKDIKSICDMYQQEKHGVRKKSTAIKLVCKKINLRLDAFQRRATKNMRFEDMQWWGISPPMCDHQCRDTAKRHAWAQMTLVIL